MYGQPQGYNQSQPYIYNQPPAQNQPAYYQPLHHLKQSLLTMATLNNLQ